MAKYTCEHCSQPFAQRYQYKKHIKRSCQPQIKDIKKVAVVDIVGMENNTCKHCSQPFSHKYQCENHVRFSCLKKDNATKTEETIFAKIARYWHYCIDEMQISWYQSNSSLFTKDSNNGGFFLFIPS
jgi:hypothetical protein